MNEYVGKICPFCKVEFRESDEIVVCSSCDMPHHKECWIENQGCTTFGCSGTIKNADGEPNTVTAKEIKYEETMQSDEIVYCTKCGMRNSSLNSFCSNCGNKLVSAGFVQPSPSYIQYNSVNSNPYTAVNGQQIYPQMIQNQSSYGNTNNYINSYNARNFLGYNQVAGLNKDIELLVGTNVGYYIPKFQELKSQNKKTSWNWPAFLVTPYWLIYRKMYGYGVGILFVNFVLSLIDVPLISFLALGINITFGLLANYIYLKELEKKVQQSTFLGEPYRSQFIAKKSGVNTLATVLTIVGYIIFYYLFVYLYVLSYYM